MRDLVCIGSFLYFILLIFYFFRSPFNIAIFSAGFSLPVHRLHYFIACLVVAVFLLLFLLLSRVCVCINSSNNVLVVVVMVAMMMMVLHVNCGRV